MKKIYYFIILLNSFSFALLANDPGKKIDPKQEKKLLETITIVLNKFHVSPINLNDDFSKKFFKEYLYNIDPNKTFLFESDVKEFKKFETKIDDQIKNKDLTFFYLTHDRIVTRMKEAKEIYIQLCKNPMDLEINEFFDENESNYSYLKNQKEHKNRVRLDLKHYMVIEYAKRYGLELNKKAIDPNHVIKSKELLEAESRDFCFKKYDGSQNNISNLNREFFYEIYLNAMVSQFDPHTKYMRPETREKFNLEMTGRLEGIGVQYGYSDNFIKVTGLVFGGSAWKDKKLEIGDYILKFADGNNDPIDVVGFTHYDLVKLVQSVKLGNYVKYTVKKKDGSIKLISIKKEKFEFGDSYAKSVIVEKNNKKYGIINLPKFYLDFDDNNQRNAFLDVKNELDQLKKAGVEGITLDLRNNGGGSIDTAVDIAGLFIDQGPIVQLKATSKEKEVLFIKQNSTIQWEGPLVVLLNNDSASASEIFAASIQDYNRGIILGGNTTYGKGTIQDIIDLNQYNLKSTEADYGAIKTTIQKYYRITGSSTQNIGVISDIAMKDSFQYKKYGEKYNKNVLETDKIDAVSFDIYSDQGIFDKVIANSNKRIKENILFDYIDDLAKLEAQDSESKMINLEINKHILEKNKSDLEEDKLINLKSTFKTRLIFKSTPLEISLIKKDEILEQKRKIWHQKLIQDIHLDEAINVMSEMVNNRSIKKISFKN
jgi:carboxyl-terminal processing protease